jgi:hypothetical protein
MRTVFGWPLGIAIWIGMTVQVTTLAILNIVFAVFVWVPYAEITATKSVMAELGVALAKQAWPLIWVELRRPFAALTMPLWVAVWRWLPAEFAYTLNTPDDPDPATQGWGGTNHEPQVLWVLNHCGRFWTRVYWLQRNCLYGAAVQSKPFPIDVTRANYSYVNGWLCARWQAKFGTLVFDRLVVERITGVKLWPGRVLAFGADVHAYVDKLGPPLVRNAKPELDPSRDTGGVPCVKLLRVEA